jgi:hypothetical protein
MILLIALIALGIVPSFCRWLRSRRLRRLAEHELEIAKSVTAMEGLLLNGALRLGQCCHDEVFIVMQTIQYRRRYPVPWNIFSKTDKETKEFERRLHAEISEPDSPAKTIIERFTRGYFRAVREKHPVETRVFVLTCIGVSGLIKILFELADGLLAAREEYYRRLQFARAKLVAASCSEVADGPREFALAN